LTDDTGSTSGLDRERFESLIRDVSPALLAFARSIVEIVADQRPCIPAAQRHTFEHGAALVTASELGHQRHPAPAYPPLGEQQTGPVDLGHLRCGPTLDVMEQERGPVGEEQMYQRVAQGVVPPSLIARIQQRFDAEHDVPAGSRGRVAQPPQMERDGCDPTWRPAR
jgi:hypothetical protein